MSLAESRAVVEWGALWTRVLAAGSDRVEVRSSPAALAMGDPLAVVVPDRWLDGSPRGVLQHESFRRELAAFSELRWYGRSPAAAALAAQGRGSGTYFVCDLGWSGASFGLCEVERRSIRVLATAFEPRAGGGAYAQSVTEGMPTQVRERFAEVQASKAARARAVLPRATGEHLDDPVYTFDSGFEITAGRLLERFGPVAEVLGERIRELDWTFDTCVLSGGFGEFPLVETVLPEHVRLGPEAAVRGGALLDSGVFGMAPPAQVEVRLPVHRVRNGLLEDADVLLTPGPGNFATLEQERLVVNAAPNGRLTVTMNGRLGELPIAQIAPALSVDACQVGLRASLDGPAALLLVPASGGEPAVVPLDGWEPA
ncbi:hypothetical protein J4573_45475 [Actinomadura barringtoniae]|uniref:Uncharacterized protein n=1 Tax=Actinomadura barringtoniae TaxID=1427535 RepID=A0A939PKF4_9ACTN|nr:hypothetical protein [Actinomadura barringtoniae]MBO2454406.1 hypothetical protein [Actinomadura barringtoniae]